jgi:hypothetical protein
VLHTVAQMTQLVYQPAFDPYNTAFRMLRLREGISFARPMPLEGVRILDFFILFPFLIGSVKLKQGDRKFRTLAMSFDHLKPYARMPESSQLLERMRPFQVAAIKQLVGSGFLDSDCWREGLFKRTETELPSSLKEAVSSVNAEQNDLVEMITEFANGYALSGVDGLKARSGLLEFRYDTV